MSSKKVARVGLHEEMLGVNTASLADCPLYQAIRTVARLGFQAIELLCFDGARHSVGRLAGFWFNRMGPEEKERLRRSVESFSGLSAHASFFDTRLFSHNPEVVDLARRQVRDAIDAMEFLGGSIVTIHINRRPHMRARDYWQEMVDALRELGDYAVERNVRLGIETGYPDTLEEFAGLIHDVQHPAVGATVDIGHLAPYLDRALRGTDEGAKAWNEAIIRLLSLLHSKTFHFHIHDVRASDWRDHREVGTGMLDYRRMFDFLGQNDYQGLLILELEEEDREAALSRSQVRLRSMLC